MPTINSNPVGTNELKNASSRDPDPVQAIDDSSAGRENLYRRAYLNSVTYSLDYGARILTGFVTTPFLIRGLGSEMFGAWQILGQFSQYIGWGDIRVTQVLKWAIARDRKTVPETELRQYVTISFCLIMLVLPVLLLAGTVISWYAPVLTRVGEEFVPAVRIATGLMVLSLILAKIFAVFESILRGMNLDFKKMGITALLLIIGGGLKIAVVLGGYGLISLALVQLLIALITGLTLYRLVKINVPWFGLAGISYRQSKSFLQISGWFMAWTGTSLLLLSSDRMLLGYFAGPALVTQYVVTRYMAGTIQGFIKNLALGIKPGIAAWYGEGKYDRILKIRRDLMTATWGLAGTIGTVVLVLNKSFTVTWIGEGSFAGHTVNLLIIISVIQYLLISNDSSFISITLDIKLKVVISLIAALVSIFASALLISRLGIAGLCLGMIAGRSIMSLAFPLIIRRKTNGGANASGGSIRTAAVTATLLAAGSLAGEYILIDSWLLLAAAAAGIAFATGAAIFYCGLNACQRRQMMSRLAQMKAPGGGR